MSKRVNKYLYWWIVQGYYAPGYGWEDLSECQDRKDALHDLREYRLGEPYASHRLIRRREPNPEYTG